MRVTAADSKLTKAQVAGAVKRTVTTGEDGKQKTEQVALKAADVLDWAVYDDERLVVITTSGEKLEGPVPKK